MLFPFPSLGHLVSCISCLFFLSHYFLKQTTPKTAGIAAFAVKTKTCMGCSVVMSNSETYPLCVSCIPRASEIWQQKLYESRHLEKQYSELWTNCQSCQGSHFVFRTKYFFFLNNSLFFGFPFFCRESSSACSLYKL